MTGIEAPAGLVGSGERSGSAARAGARALAVLPIALIVAAQLIVFPMPAGVWIQGAVFGLLGALMAVGLGLVYRLNHVVNFAQGDLGSAPSVLVVGLVGLSGVNYFLGLATGLVATVLLTALCEILVVRRFARSPRLVLTVATIGLSQALIVVSLLLPNIWGQAPIGSAVVHIPWHLALHLAPVTFTADDVVAVVVAVVALCGVALWSKVTDLGVASRAIGDRRDRAAMLGIPVNRVQTLTWIVAGLLSFLSIFLKAAIVGLPLDPTFSLTALASALAALAVGGFVDLTVVAVAAVAIGVLEQGVAWDEPTRPTLVLAVVAAVVLMGMAMGHVSRRTARRSDTQWSLAANVRDIPPVVRRLVEVRLASAGTIIAAVAFLVTLPLWLGPSTMLDLSDLVVLAIVGCSIVILTGWAGQVSLGQMSFAAVGAVAGAVAIVDWHWDLSLALLLGGAAGAVVAYLIGLPTLRLDGIFVAVTTLAFGLALSGYFLVRAQFSWIPGGQLPTTRLFGIPIVSENGVFLTCLGVFIVVVAAESGLRHSRFGRVLRALSTNERAVAGFGVDVGRAKLSAFAVSGFVAGLAGCLLLLVNQQYIETPFTETASLTVFTATAVGGLGSVVGAVVGAALVEGSTIFLPPSWQLFPPAFGVLIVLLAYPGGVASLVYKGRDRFLLGVARRHGLETAIDRSFPPSAPRSGPPPHPRGDGSTPGDAGPEVDSSGAVPTPALGPLAARGGS